MVDAEDVRSRLVAAFPGAQVRVADSTGAGDHFDVEVTTGAFVGKTLVEQHRMVYGALGELMPRIHALALRTFTPKEDAR